MVHPPERDGITYIDIGSGATTAIGKQLGWYRDFPKTHPDGYGFRTYAGLHYYLITEGDNRRFLKAATKEELAASKRYHWENVKGLEIKLGYALKHNLKINPVALQWVRDNSLPIVWLEPFHALKNAEKRWLRVVKQVIHDLQVENR
jgi:hypothetical protein